MCKVTSYDQPTHGYIISGPVDPYNLYFGMWSNTFQIWNNSNPWAGGAMRVTSVGTNATFPINNTWVHLCMTYTGGVIRPYVNGIAMNTINSQQNWDTTAPDIYIGGSPGNDGFYKVIMSVAELRIYSTVLSAVEVETLDSYLGKKYLYQETTNTVSSVGSTSWNPSQITTDLWLDASDSTTLTSVSGAISEWRDKSGNSRNAVQSIVDCRPSTSTLNNLTTLKFDGINDNMNIATTILQSQSKPNIFYVFVPDNNNSNNAYSPEITFNSTNNGDNGSFHYIKSNLLGASYPMYTAGGWGNYDNSGSGYVYGSAEMISFITLTSSYNVYRNGILEGSSTAGNALSNSTGLQLAQQQGSRTSGISFAEIVLVFGASTQTIQIIEGYLAWKWGLVSKLPITHPYKSVKP